MKKGKKWLLYLVDSVETTYSTSLSLALFLVLFWMRLKIKFGPCLQFFVWTRLCYICTVLFFFVSFPIVNSQKIRIEAETKYISYVLVLFCQHHRVSQKTQNKLPLNFIQNWAIIGYNFFGWCWPILKPVLFSRQ